MKEYPMNYVALANTKIGGTCDVVDADESVLTVAVHRNWAENDCDKCAFAGNCDDASHKEWTKACLARHHVSGMDVWFERIVE